MREGREGGCHGVLLSIWATPISGASCRLFVLVTNVSPMLRCSKDGLRGAVMLRVCPGTSCGIAEPSQHEADRGKAEEGERLAGEVLPILGQSTAAVQPRYGAFDAPLDNVA